MNRSQTRATVGVVAATVGAVCAAILPHVDSLPPEYRMFGVALSILSSVAGSVVTLLNQSLHPGHKSFPNEVVERRGLLPDKAEASKEVRARDANLHRL